MSTFETITVAINIGVLVLLVLQLQGLKDQIAAAAQEASDRNVRERKRETMDVYAATLSTRIELRNELEDDRDAGAIAGMVERLKDRKSDDHEGDADDQRDAAHHYLNYWEMLASGVNSGILDYETASLIARGKIIAIYRNYGPYIDWRREIYGDSVYSELEMIAKRLEADQAREAVDEPNDS